MNRHVSGITKLIGLVFITAMLAIGASAQIRIGNIEIKVPKNPQPKNPPPTVNTNPTTPNPNGNRTPTTPSANTRPTTNSSNEGTGATRDQVFEFLKDMQPYKEGIYGLRFMANTSDGNNPQCHEAKDIARDLEQAAAFLEIIKQKYPGIENPTWSNENTGAHKVGDFRRYAENRMEIAKKCVNGLMRAKVAEKIASIEDAIAGFDKGEWGGSV